MREVNDWNVGVGRGMEVLYRTHRNKGNLMNIDNLTIFLNDPRKRLLEATLDWTAIVRHA